MNLQHPNLKNIPVFTMLSEGVAKKCGKQEISFLNAPVNLYETLFNIQIAGYKPVLAHPERYAYYHNDFSAYQKLKDAGCLFQLNLLSLSNYYGSAVTTASLQLLKHQLVDFAGTDTHRQRHLNFLEKINNRKAIR